MVGSCKVAGIPKHPADVEPGGASKEVPQSMTAVGGPPSSGYGQQTKHKPGTRELAPIPQKTPGTEWPVFNYPGGVDTIGAGVRNIARHGVTPGLPQFTPVEGSKVMTPGVANMLNQFAVPWAWNQVKPYRPRQLGNSPFTAHSLSQRVPQQYRNAGAAAQHALRTFTPYQNGPTQGAEMVNQFMQDPRGMLSDPQILDRMQGVMQGIIR